MSAPAEPAPAGAAPAPAPTPASPRRQFLLVWVAHLGNNAREPAGLSRLGARVRKLAAVPNLANTLRRILSARIRAVSECRVNFFKDSSKIVLKVPRWIVSLKFSQVTDPPHMVANTVFFFIAPSQAFTGDVLTLRGAVVRPDGTQRIEAEGSGPVDDPEAVGRQVAQELLAHGAGKLFSPV